MQTKNYLAILALVVVVLAGGAYAFSGSGKSQEAAVAQTPTTPTTQMAPTTPADTNVTRATAPSTAKYKDGTYTATGDYRAPSGQESINVSLTLKGDTIVDSSVTSSATNHMTQRMQGLFISGYKALVTGKNIDEVSLSNVSGSSLTSSGFNAALEQIKTQAKA